MFQTAPAAASFASKSELHAELALQLSGLFTGERDRIANAANMSALIFDMLPDLNWAGFYFLNAAGDELVVGPFQGKPACVRIAVGRGVCGTSVAEARSIVVPDVHAFPGHIACDAASRSELVVPLLRDGKVIGVLDLDSPHPGRFDDEDRAGLEKAAAIFVDATDF
ncbi:Free methionine-(R)-sulfoxide reductase, contains GAF domain [Devosia sp. H5989]|nr:Free methionine-(R)-sulfoxide reductase, contains GAF domain [Devosia sp. H5989]